jgi:hypothetical protein
VSPAAPADPARPCLNCDSPLPSPLPPFCPQCGQETTLRPPRLGEFLQQWGGAFISTEGALWRTLRLLVLRPGELTRQYLAGRRKHYVLPLRLYLTTSVIVLLLIRVLAALTLEPTLHVKGDVVIEAPKEISIDFGFGRTGRREGQFYCENLPRWFCDRVERRLDTDPKRFRHEAAQIGDRILGNLGAAMFLLLPSFAFFTFLAYWNRGLRYTEHLVFALHVHAFWFLAIAVAAPDIAWLSAIAFTSIPVYTMLAMRRVFGGGLLPRLLRAGFIVTMYSVVLAIAVLASAIVAILN